MRKTHSYIKLNATQCWCAGVEQIQFTYRSIIYVLALLCITFIALGNTTAIAGSCESLTEVRKVYAHDFQAVGDGINDDGPALRAALKAVVEGTKPASLELDAGKTYRITSFEDTYALRILNTQQVTLHGNGAELLLLPPNKVLRLADSSDVNVCKLTIDYSPLPFTQGIVVATDEDTGTFDLEIEEGFDVPEVDSDAINDNSKVWKFAIPYKQGEKFEKRVEIKNVHATSENRQIRITPANNSPTKSDDLIPDETHLVMAMPGKGQVGNFAFQILNNNGVYVEGIRVYAAPQLTFYVANNQGAINFVNIEQRIRPGTTRVMTGWRDVFHVKDNRTSVQWNGCYTEGAFDDSFNLSAMYQRVVKKLGKKSWLLRDLGLDGAPIYKVGDRLQAIDFIPKRKFIGETTIVSVTQDGAESIVKLSDDLPLNAEQKSCDNCGSHIVNLDAANEGSVIRNCTILGTVRLRSATTLEQCKLDGLFQITSSPKEGPLPKDVLVQNCELSGNIKIGPDFNAKQEWSYGERWVQNLQFRNNRILSVFRAEGASFSLIDNDIAWPAARKFDLKNSRLMSIRNLTENGSELTNPLSRVSIGQNMTVEDVLSY